MDKKENVLDDIKVSKCEIKHIKNGTLVLEGGAFRGIYVSGVLDCLLDHNINIKTVLGVSAGALNGMNYLAGNRGRGAVLGLKHRHNPKFMSAKNLFANKGLLNLDFYFDDFNKEIPICEKNLFNKKHELIAMATNVETGKPEYFSSLKDKDILFDGLKASSTIPILSKTVNINGMDYLDGGCYNELPLSYALANRMKKIIVVSTKSKKYRYDLANKNNKSYNIVKSVFGKKKNFLGSLKDSPKQYNEELDKAEELEEKGKILFISPSVDLDVEVTDGDISKLKKLYELGYQDTLAKLDEIKKFLKSWFK